MNVHESPWVRCTILKVQPEELARDGTAETRVGPQPLKSQSHQDTIAGAVIIAIGLIWQEHQMRLQDLRGGYES